jgi:hypothetical protein
VSEQPHWDDDERRLSTSDADRLYQAIRDLTNVLAAVRKDLSEGLANVSDEVARTYVREDVLQPRLDLFEERQTNIQKEVDKQNGRWDWLIKAVAAAGFTIVGSLFVAFVEGAFK